MYGRANVRTKGDNIIMDFVNKICNSTLSHIHDIKVWV